MAIRDYPRWRPAANLDLMSPEIAPFDPPTLKTVYPRTRHHPLQRWPFAYVGDIWNRHLGEGEVVGGQRWHHSKERWWFPIGSPLWPLRYICNHSAAICDRMSPTLKSTGGGSIWAQISGCSPWSRPMMFGSAESEHPMLTNGEIISEKFQPLITIHQRYRQTDRRTDRQTTCDRNTKVYCAAKIGVLLRKLSQN